MSPDTSLRQTRLGAVAAEALLILGLLLVPSGYGELDDPCSPVSDAQTKPRQCGLTCNGNGTMGPFDLCEPFEVGQAYWIVIGVVVLVAISIPLMRVPSKDALTAHHSALVAAKTREILIKGGAVKPPQNKPAQNGTVPHSRESLVAPSSPSPPPPLDVTDANLTLRGEHAGSLEIEV